MAQGKVFEVEKAVTTLHNWPQRFAHYNYTFPSARAAIMHTESPSIATLKKYQDEATALLTVASAIVFALEMVEVKAKPTAPKVQMIAKLVMDEFYYLRLSEVKFCITRALYGDYGELFGKVDAMDVLRWLKLYAEHRGSEMQRVREEEQSRYRQEGEKMTVEAAQRIAAILAKIEAKNLLDAKKTANAAKRRELNKSAERERAKLQGAIFALEGENNPEARTYLEQVRDRAAAQLERLEEELLTFET